MDYNHRPYQERMTKFVIDNHRCGLFAEMGLGKTVTTLTALDHLMYEEFSVGRAIIIAPLRVSLITWPNEIRKWSHTRRLKYSIVYGPDCEAALRADADIYIISYSTLPWLVKYLKQYKEFPYDYDVVVFDESTYIKNSESQRSTICNALFYDVPRKILLTGTPSPNGLHDLWGQIFHLDHGRALGATVGEFRQRYFIKEGHKYFPIRRAKERITEQLAHLVMPMKAVDYLSLPSFTVNTVKCCLGDTLMEQYDKLEQNFFTSLDGIEVTAVNAGALSMKLRQFVQGFLIDDNGAAKKVHTVKIDTLVDILDQVNGNVLVAVQFRKDIEMIKEKLGNVPCIYGGTKIKDDMHTIERWNRKEIPVLIAHPASLAHGVNLQHGGHTLVWYGLPWSLEHFDQFNARIHRQGQSQRVIAHVIVTEGSIDELLVDVLRRKTRTQEDLMRGIQHYRAAKSL